MLKRWYKIMDLALHYVPSSSTLLSWFRGDETWSYLVKNFSTERKLLTKMKLAEPEPLADVFLPSVSLEITGI